MSIKRQYSYFRPLFCTVGEIQAAYTFFSWKYNVGFWISNRFSKERNEKWDASASYSVWSKVFLKIHTQYTTYVSFQKKIYTLTWFCCRYDAAPYFFTSFHFSIGIGGFLYALMAGFFFLPWIYEFSLKDEFVACATSFEGAVHIWYWVHKNKKS